MIRPSRRDFFAKLLGDVKSAVSEVWPSRGCSEAPNRKERRAEGESVALGRVADFSPGTTTELGALGVTVVSLAEGVYAVRTRDLQVRSFPPRLSLSISREGILFSDLEGVGPGNSVLSVMTGEWVETEETKGESI